MNPTGAQTRFNNDRVRAAQRHLGSNPAAANSMKEQRSSGLPNEPSGPPVGDAVKEGNQVPPGFQPIEKLTAPPSKIRKNPVQGQSVLPDTPRQAAQGQDQSSKDGVTRLIHEMQFDKLLNSPDMQDAFTKIKVRDYLKGRETGSDSGRRMLNLIQRKR